MGVRLVGDRLVLREFELADEEALHAIVSDPAVTEHTLWGPNDASATRSFLVSAVAQADTSKTRPAYHLAATEPAEDKLIGSVTLDVENTDHARGIVGFVLEPRSWGQGLAYEALALMLDFGFERLGLHRIAVLCEPDHAPCARVLEKAGMTLEGRMRGYRRVRGQWRDCHLYARLAED